MNKKLIEKTRSFVLSECKKPESHYGLQPFDNHFVPMVRHALDLAKKYKADEEIVALAGWLHDIGSIVNGRKDHHKTSANIAEEFLKKQNYPADRIKLIKDCILKHRGSIRSNRVTLEEKIIAEADVMNNFDNIAGPFMAAFLYEGLDQKQATRSIREKLKRKWRQLHFPESKRLLKKKYEAAMLLLS